MNAHQRIDRWSLDMMREIISRIDVDPDRAGLERARATAKRWAARGRTGALVEWLELLEQPWEELREILLDQGEQGQRLRSSAPFCGILSPRERLELFRKHRASERA